MTTVAGIRRMVPHRWPMLLVDRVGAVEPGRRLTAYTAVSGREPHYRSVPEGADDAAYTYPIGLLLESWVQAAVLLRRWDDPNPDVRTGRVELLAGLRDIRVLAAAYPGDLVEHQVELDTLVAGTAIFSGRCSTGGRLLLDVGRVTVSSRKVADLLPQPERSAS